jgi:hypothetical protein
MPETRMDQDTENKPLFTVVPNGYFKWAKD